MNAENGNPRPEPPVAGGVLLDAATYLEEAAIKMGLLCSNCGQPIEGEGLQYLVLDVADAGPDGQATVVRATTHVCRRAECEEVREALDADCVAKRDFPAWELLPSGPFGRTRDKGGRPSA